MTHSVKDRRWLVTLAGGILFLVLCPASAASTPANSPENPPTAGPSESPVRPGPTRQDIPPDARPPGEREPLIGILAAGSIVVAAVAGIYVYRVIRKGL